MRALTICAVAGLAALQAHSRSDNGTLGIIRVPNNGQPAIVVRGESFNVRATGEPDIFAASDSVHYDLPEEWRPLPGGIFEATVYVPAEFEPGLYGIVGDTGEAEDIQERALLVLEEAPNSYDLAHIASPRFHDSLEASLAGSFDRNPPLAVIVTGSLTESGAPDDFRTLIDWLNTCPVPTIVAPGPSDSGGGRLHEYFDPAPHSTACGDDAILAIGESVAHRGEEDFGDAGVYQVIRRRTKPARWSIGVSGYPHDRLSLRVQITLFVDTPLHVWIAGREERDASGQVPQRVIWDSFQGSTSILTPAEDAPPGIQWIRVTPTGVSAILPGEGGDQ